mgnify:CR=1 FL=1
MALKKVRVRNLAAGLPKSVIREIRALSALRSPHLIRLLRYFAFGAGVVLVLEYMASDALKLAKTLSQRTGARLPLAAVRSLTRDTVEGLWALHGKGVMHRDVKPGNVLVDSDGRAVLGDLGMARVYQQGQVRRFAKFERISSKRAHILQYMGILFFNVAL